MSNPTSNYGWQMPTATDLVTDLPADFEVFGQAVDTALMDLKGGTTGQVLSKASATDMDFTWVTDPGGDITGVTAGTGISGGGTSGTVTVTNDMATTITTNGDLIYGTGSGTYTRRAIGSSGNVLTVSGGIPVWSAPSSGLTLITRSSFSGATSVTYDNVFSGTYSNYLLSIEEIYTATATADYPKIQFRYSGTTQTASYAGNYVKINTGTGAFTNAAQTSGSILFTTSASRADDPISGCFFIQNTTKKIAIQGAGNNTYQPEPWQINAFCDQARTYTGFIINTGATNCAGTIAIYGLAE